MNSFDFKKSLDKFEKEVIVCGVSLGTFGKKLHISVKPCKLSKTPFGSFIGDELNSTKPLVVDYYGYLKKSKGFYEVVEGNDIVYVHVVHFASIRIEDIVSVTDDVNLIASFPRLKSIILSKRGFGRR